MELIDLEQLTQREEKALVCSKEQMELLNNERYELLNKIRNGEATAGSAVKDFAFVLNGGRLFSSLYPPLEEVYEKVNRNIGKEFLLLIHKQIEEPEHGCFRSSRGRSLLYAAAGVVEGEVQFDLKSQDHLITIPMEFYITSTQDATGYFNGIPPGNPFMSPGNKPFDFFGSDQTSNWEKKREALSFSANILYSASTAGEILRNQCVQTYVGEEVKEHFTKFNHNKDPYEKMLDALTLPDC